MMVKVTTTTTTEPVCKCCDGRGWQERNDGIRIPCPGCVGGDVHTVPYYPVPYYPSMPYPPWEITCHA